MEWTISYMELEMDGTFSYEGPRMPVNLRRGEDFACLNLPIEAVLKSLEGLVETEL